MFAKCCVSFVAYIRTDTDMVRMRSVLSAKVLRIVTLMTELNPRAYGLGGESGWRP